MGEVGGPENVVLSSKTVRQYDLQGGASVSTMQINGFSRSLQLLDEFVDLEGVYKSTVVCGASETYCYLHISLQLQDCAAREQWVHDFSTDFRILGVNEAERRFILVERRIKFWVFPKFRAIDIDISVELRPVEV